jgi:hypothetical protein
MTTIDHFQNLIDISKFGYELYILGITVFTIYIIIHEIIQIIKRYYLKVKYTLYTYFYQPITNDNSITNNHHLQNFYQAICVNDSETIFDHIADQYAGNINLYYQFIEEHLLDKKFIIKNIIDVMVADTILRKKMTGYIFYQEFMNTFLFCYGLDYKYTKKLIMNAYNNNPNNHILKLHSVFFSSFIQKPIVSKYENKIEEYKNEIASNINQLEKENNLMKEHIKYQPDGEIFFGLMNDFYNKARKN